MEWKFGEMNMSWLFYLLPCMLLVHNVVDFTENGACQPYAQRLNCLITDYVEMLENCNHLRLVNKTGCFGDKIYHIGLQFESDDFNDINTGRKYMLALIDSFVKIMHQEPRLLPYLTCPFTSNNIELRIHFVGNCLYPYPTPGQIAHISFAEGIITYSVQNPRRPGELEKLREETLDFAQRVALID